MSKPEWTESREVYGVPWHEVNRWMYALAWAAALAGCKDERQGFASGARPTTTASATASVSSVGDKECDAFLDRLRICNPAGARTQEQMRENMVTAIANPTTRAEAVAVCTKSFDMLRRSCPQPGDPPIEPSPSASASASPSASGSASAGAMPTGIASGSASPR